MLVFLAVVLARMLDPIALVLCGGIGLAVGKYAVAAPMGAFVYMVIMAAVSGGKFAMLPTMIAGAAISCIFVSIRILFAKVRRGNAA